ncbi:MAG TPA: cytochrome c3 family protein [Kofleriaceae bacterium]|nr:cytochrome c3 family protein [Kofleriaceae bacterium]
MWRALVLLVLAVGIAAADGPRTTAFGFDHTLHDRNLVVSGGEALACGRCHNENKGKLVGKPGHSACFGACHGPVPKAPARGAKIATGDKQRVCENCHSEAALAAKFTGKLAASYPPYTIDPDFSVAFGHKQHAAVTCTQCHDVRDKPAKLTVHARCSSCHDGSGAAGHGPAMSTCTGCHPQAVGKPQPAELAAVINSVTSTFSHPRHASRGALGKDCATCHAPIRGTNDTQLPRPTVASCGIGGCHDAKAAFATTAACTRCHDRAPGDRFDVWRPTQRFEHHGNHEQVVKTQPCSSCHRLTTTGEVHVGGHAPCAECHADDFGARRPRICGACHNSTEPWRRLVTDRAPPERTEFGATLDHAKHTGECTSCHTLRTASSNLRTSRGHAACTGSGCHAAANGAVPHLTECTACHQLGLADTREAARMKAPWTVRAAFDHDTHRTTKNGNELACGACHTDLSGADVLALPTPKKATCLACHDTNKTAFKVTGTTCKRCHGGKN